jgi:hypothetical protein
MTTPKSSRWPIRSHGVEIGNSIGSGHQTGQLQPLIDQIAKWPKDTVINSVVLPQMRAAIEIDATTPERLNS